MNLFKLLGLVILALILAVLIGIAVKSPESHMERSIVINAPPAQVYAYLNDFRNFNEWSPWAALDPDTEYTFSGPFKGPGARMSWHSTHEQVGDGEQWITEVRQNEYVKSGMQFGDFEGKFYAEFILKPVADGTEVTWTYHGDVSDSGLGWKMAGKVFGMFLESMLGPFYEDGLKSLKTVVEEKPLLPMDEVMPADSAEVQP